MILAVPYLGVLWHHLEFIQIALTPDPRNRSQ
jgi:hypothetical protein